jgi:hypothetical protein
MASISRVSSNLVNIAWSSASGATYRVQYRTNLLVTNWLDLTTNITATGATASTNLPITTSQRFHRIMALP